MAALLASLAGFGGASSVLVLAAIVVGAVRLIEAVGLAAEERGDRVAVVLSSVALVCLVAAGATHVVALLAGVLVCAAVDLLGRPDGLVELPVEAAADLRRAA